MNDGKNLWQAIDLVVRAGGEIDALVAELSKKMTERLSREGADLGMNFDTGDEEDQNATGDWVCVAWLLQWGLKPKGKGKKSYIGNLSVQIVMWTEDGFQDPCGCIPRVEIAYMCTDDEMNPSYYEAGTWLPRDDNWSDWSVSDERKCLMHSKTQKPRFGAKWDESRDWIFVVPLFSLNSIQDIDQNIIEPVVKLLGGTATHDALGKVPAIEFTISKGGVLCQHTPVS